MSDGFKFTTIYLDSSSMDTDPDGLANAIQVAGGDLIEEVYAPYVSTDGDDTEDDFPPWLCPWESGPIHATHRNLLHSRSHGR